MKEIVEARPGILHGGLRLLLVNKRVVLWSYLALLFVGLVSGASMHARVGPFLDHSLAAQKLAGSIDIAYFGELVMHSSEHDAGTGPVTGALTVVAVLLSFFFAAGILYVFLSGEEPRLAIVLGRGVEYFWRFFRLLLFAAIIGGPILGLLGWLRSAYLQQANKKFVEAAYHLRSWLSLVVLLLVAVSLRIWFDLAEVYVVKLGTEGDRRVRRSLGPSLRLFRRNFLHVFLSYFAAGTLGWLAFAFFLWIWAASQTSHLILPVFLWSQVALAFLLASRIWQRGILAALVLAEPAAVYATEAFVAEVPATQGISAEFTDPELINPEFIEPERIGPERIEPGPVREIVEPEAALPMSSEATHDLDVPPGELGEESSRQGGLG